MKLNEKYCIDQALIFSLKLILVNTCYFVEQNVILFLIEIPLSLSVLAYTNGDSRHSSLNTKYTCLIVLEIRFSKSRNDENTCLITLHEVLLLTNVISQ